MSQPTEPRVAALVLNYNGRDITLESLESLAAMTYPNLEIVHIDNGSTDGSYEAVAEAFPDVHQVRVEENQGVVFGMNKGMQAALARGADYLLLLNNDIEAEPAMLTELMRVIESDPQIGVVGPKIYYHADRKRLWSAGGYLRFRESACKERGFREIDEGQYDRTEEVPYINGCAMLVPRRVVEEIGLWDPLFHLAADDADWCMRMKRRGYKCFYAHEAVLYHMVSPTLGGYKPSRTFHNGRSLALFVRRYAGPWQWLTFVLSVATAFPVAWLRELPRGNQGAAVAKLKGVIAGLKVPLAPPPRVGDNLEAQS